jgi:hypothetical protein
MRGKILIFGLKTVRLDDGGSSLRYEEPHFWGKNEPRMFGKVFESWKTYKNLYETYKN